MSARAEPGIAIRLPDINELRKAYAELPKTLAAVSLAAACKRALQPATGALKKNTPRGPTGNLARAVTIKSVTYSKTRTGVAVVGYKKAGSGKSKAAAGGRVRKGSDRAFHQFWIEFGTKERRIKTPSHKGFFIASSFNSLGPFRLFRKALVRGGAKVVQSSPKYPKAFFKSFPKNVPLVLPPVHPEEPILRTWREVRPEAAHRLEGEMRKGLVNAQKQLAIRAEKANAKKQAALDRAAAGWATLF